ncbi:MAG: aminotransferase class III-fold pyridoxal phosphate-dependent enzyme [Candidatus Kapaibacterium sp.]
MKLFDVYPRFDIEIERAEGVNLYDKEGSQYLDLYGGHGVISIGHSHPTFVKSIKVQLDKISFYSNSIQMPSQEELADKLTDISGYKDFKLFLCNSGAEANENAIKLASFHTGKSKVIAFKGSFHGRTAAALNVTDNIKLSAPININNFPVEFIELNNEEQLIQAISGDDVCAVICEGIQGVGGLDLPSNDYLKFLRNQCSQNNIILILDEIQSGSGRTGKYFAHQFADIEADIITMAKGIGNGFPIAGLLINPKIKAKHGLLGTTFGGSYLACAAGLSVVEVIEKENLMMNSTEISNYINEELGHLKIKGKGLMIGLEFDFPIKELRSKLLFKHKIFTGSSANPNLLRILPPLTITKEQISPFIKAIKELT